MTGRDRVLAMLAGRRVDHLPFMPITMMFAADQLGVPYGRYVRDHRVLVEAQCLVAERFDFDQVGCVSDPTREAHDCGATVHFFENQPAAIVESDALLAEPADLLKLAQPDPYAGRMLDRLQAIELFRKRLGAAKIIEGWIEGPMAEACDLRGINTLMTDMLDSPAFCRDLLAFCTELGLRFARAQIEMGANVIGIGDAAASLVGPTLYEELIWPFEKRLIDGIHESGGLVRMHVCGNATRILPKMAELNCDIIDIDYPVPMTEARRQLGPDPVLLGNLNPVADLRNRDAAYVTDALRACHRAAGSRYIVGAGCEVTRDTSIDNVKAMRDYALQAA